MRIVHLSDIHVWRYTWNPKRLLGKRLLGVAELLRGRARKFRLERLDEVVRRVLSLDPDHILITGDLTTTALAAEFRDARIALADLLIDSGRVTMIPGNHDRYTTGSVRKRAFEHAFGSFQPSGDYPWLRTIDPQTAILGLDPTRPHLTARGYLPAAQLERAWELTEQANERSVRLIVACHYPLAAPPRYERELRHKRLLNAQRVREWALSLGRHIYCCGHVHAAWAFSPPSIPDQLCLNAGAPLLHDPTGYRLPGFLEITLDGPSVGVEHHAWTGQDWKRIPMLENPHFFDGFLPTSFEDSGPELVGENQSTLPDSGPEGDGLSAAP